MQCFHGHLPQEAAGVKPSRQEIYLTCSRTDAARSRPASVRGDNNGCSKGPPIKLSDGLARTKTEPISMPATPTIPVSSIRVRCANGNSYGLRLKGSGGIPDGWG